MEEEERERKLGRLLESERRKLEAAKDEPSDARRKGEEQTARWEKQSSRVQPRGKRGKINGRRRRRLGKLTVAPPDTFHSLCSGESHPRRDSGGDFSEQHLRNSIRDSMESEVES